MHLGPVDFDSDFESFSDSDSVWHPRTEIAKRAISSGGYTYICISMYIYLDIELAGKNSHNWEASDFAICEWKVKWKISELNSFRAVNLHENQSPLVPTWGILMQMRCHFPRIDWQLFGLPNASHSNISRVQQRHLSRFQQIINGFYESKMQPYKMNEI